VRGAATLVRWRSPLVGFRNALLRYASQWQLQRGGRNLAPESEAPAALVRPASGSGCSVFGVLAGRCRLAPHVPVSDLVCTVVGDCSGRRVPPPTCLPTCLPAAAATVMVRRPEWPSYVNLICAVVCVVLKSMSDIL